MKNAVIIGAGPAGLSAAYTLLKEGKGLWHVVVLESNAFPGGIARTIVHGENRIDIGGHRFFSKNDEVNRIWEELMPAQGAPAKDDVLLKRKVTLSSGGPDPEHSDCVMLRRHRVSRIYYHRHFFSYPISINLNTIAMMGVFNTLTAGLSYLKSILFKRQETSLEDFYINRFGKKLYAMFFEDYTEKLWGIHPSKISPEWGAQRVKGLSFAKAIANIFIRNDTKRETSLIEEFLYPKKGPGQLWEVMASEIVRLGGDIRYNEKVTRIEQGWKVNNIEADAVFSSMPIKDLVAAFSAAPANVHEVASALPYRDFMTVGLLVNRLAMKNQTKLATVGNIIPDTWIYVQEHDVRMGRIQIFNNWSPYMVDDFEKHIWIGLEYFCAEGDGLWSMADKDFVAYAVDELRRIGVLDATEQILDSVCIRVTKAYPAYFGSYRRFGEIRNWLSGFNGLYCIGRNGQHRYNNMDHSMLCGINAARSLLNGTNPLKVWEVNAEKEYHEEK